MAASIKSGFSQYYNQIMPDLKMILTNVQQNNDKNLELRALTIETIGYFVAAIKDNQQLFNQEYLNLTKTFIQLQTKIPANDPQQESIITFYMQIATVLGPKFGQIMDTICPALLNALDIDISMSLTQKTRQDQNKNIVSVTLDLKLHGGQKVLSVDTMAIQIKKAAAACLVEIAKSMKSGFFKYVEKAWPVVQKYINYNYAAEIREYMQQMVALMIESCSTEDQKASLFMAALPFFVKEAASMTQPHQQDVEKIYVIFWNTFKCLELLKNTVFFYVQYASLR